MAHTTDGVITAPISLQDDVYNVLGVTKSGTYYDIGFICSDQKDVINPIARYKPVIYSGPESVDEYWRATDGNCGLVFNPSSGGYTSNYLTDMEDIAAMVDGDMNGWVYQPPVPGTHYCRLSDFDGYDHYAEWDARLTVSSETVSNHSVLDNFTVSFYTRTVSLDADLPGNLYVTDLASFKNWYFGLMLVDSSGNAVYTKIADTVGGETSLVKVTIYPGKTTNFIDSGSYTIIPFMINSRYTNLSYKCAPLPKMGTLSVTVTDQLIRIFLEEPMEKPTTAGSYDYKVGITNMGSASVTLKGNDVFFRFNDISNDWSNYTTAARAGEVLLSTDSITVAGGSTGYLSGTVTVTQTLIDNGIKVFVIVGQTGGASSPYKRVFQLLMQAPDDDTAIIVGADD